jgi:hypothetical protein
MMGILRHGGLLQAANRRVKQARAKIRLRAVFVSADK